MYVETIDQEQSDVHRDAYVLGQGFWLFTRYLAHLLKNSFGMKWSLSIMLQYSKMIFDVDIKVLPLHLLLMVQKMVSAPRSSKME